MFIGFPTNTVILIFALMIAVSAGTLFILSQGIKQALIAPRLRRAWAWGAAILLIGWISVRLALSVNPPNAAVIAPQALILVSFGITLLAGILPLLISPVFRQIIRAMPQTWLVGLHAFRIGFGFLFLTLMDMKLLPPQFALPSGYGDITVGFLAIGMVYVLSQKKPYARALTIGWILLGLLDFGTALVTGLTFITPFAAQVAASGGSLSYLNYVFLVPSYYVPLYTVLLMYTLYKLSKRGVSEPEQAVQTLAYSRGGHSLQP